MFDPEHWSPATVVGRTQWDEGLFTIQLDRPMDFEAGQFVKLCQLKDGVHCHRAYSIASAPGAPLEFYIVRVEGGELTPLLDALRPGGVVGVMHKVAGGFVLSKIPVDEADTAWLISTGTGLAPYISMLRDGSIWERFRRVVVVHGVRDRNQLGYREELEAMAAANPALTYLPACTRDDAPGCLNGRIPALFDAGVLEAAASASIDPTSHVMMCGNPEMIVAMRERLTARGMLLHTPKRHGRVHLERYW